jgi:hypothetical protein
MADAQKLKDAFTRPAWVHECIRDYMAQGMSEEEAEERCYGAWQNRAERSALRRVSLAEPEGVIEAYLAVWGSHDQRDDYGTWFDREKPAEMGLRFLPFPLMYEHTWDGELGNKIIGEVYAIWPDDVGIKYRARLDKQGLDNGEFLRITSEIQRGELGTSTGSAPHLAEFDGEGRFVNWLISEVTLTKAPAETRMPSAVLVRSKTELMQDAPTEDGPRGCGGGSEKNNLNGKAGEQRMSNKPKGATRQVPVEALNEELAAGLQALVDKFGVDVVQEAIKAFAGDGEEIPPEMPEEMAAMASPQATLSALKAKAEEIAVRKRAEEATATIRALNDKVDALTLRMQAEPPEEPPLPELPAGATRSSGGAGRIEVRDLRFHHLSAAEMAFGYQVLRAVPFEKRQRQAVLPVSDDYMRAMMTKVHAEAQRGDKLTSELIYTRAIPFTRADIMGSDVTGYGDEWVGIFYESDLWEKIRIAPVWEQFRAKGLVERSVSRGYESTLIPLEGDDPTWYTISQAVNVSAAGYPEVQVPESKVSTGQKSISTKIAAAYVPFTDSLTEDSIVEVAPQVRSQMIASGQEHVEYLMINGDTGATSANINTDGTPAANAGYLAADGMLKLPLVTNTDNARDAGSTFDEDDFRLLFPLLGTNGKHAANRDKLFFVIDFSVQDAAINIPSVKSKDVFSGATIESGELVKIWRVDVLTSGQLAKAQTDGTISDTAASNTRGRILLTRPDQWAVGYKREMTTEIQRWAPAFTTMIVCSFRIGMAYRDTYASAVSYGVAV